jgi:Transglutaminase-like superfamily
MWARLRRFKALPRPAKELFLRAALLLPFLTLSLRLRGFRSTQAFLQNLLAPSRITPQDAAIESHIVLTSRMVLAAARHSPIHSTCLERSLCLWWLLARQGTATELRIGVRKDGGQFAAHAWVEYNAIAIGEPEAPHLHYAAFAEEMTGHSS